MIKGLLLGWFLASFEPLQEVLRLIKNKIPDEYWVVMYIKIALSCQKCLTFWSTLIITHNLYAAIASSIIVVLIDWIKQDIEDDRNRQII